MGCLEIIDGLFDLKNGSLGDGEEEALGVEPRDEGELGLLLVLCEEREVAGINTGQWLQRRLHGQLALQHGGGGEHQTGLSRLSAVAEKEVQVAEEALCAPESSAV